MLLDDDHTKHGTLRASFTNEKMDVYSVNVDASASTDTDGTPVASYRFDFGDGTPVVTTTAPAATSGKPARNPPTKGASTRKTSIRSGMLRAWYTS